MFVYLLSVFPTSLRAPWRQGPRSLWSPLGPQHCPAHSGYSVIICWVNKLMTRVSMSSAHVCVTVWMVLFFWVVVSCVCLAALWDGAQEDVGSCVWLCSSNFSTHHTVCHTEGLQSIFVELNWMILSVLVLGYLCISVFSLSNGDNNCTHSWDPCGE